MSDILNVTVRILPSGEEVEVELPVHTTPFELLTELTANKILPGKNADGSIPVYELIHERTKTPIGKTTLLEHGVGQNDVLLCVPKLISAGAENNNAAARIPDFPSSAGKGQDQLINIQFIGTFIKDEIELEIPIYYTGKEIIDKLTGEGIIPFADSRGSSFLYQLTALSVNRSIPETTSLMDLGIKEFEIIECSPNLLGEQGISGRPTPATKAGHVSVIIRIMPKGDEIDVELPVSSTGAEIIQELLLNDLMPRADREGNPYVYQLIRLTSNRVIEDDASLAACGITAGEILLCVPKLVAGGFSGSMIFQIPSVLELEKKALCRVRISRESFERMVLREGFGTDANIHKIEISDLMIVKLKENALHEHLKIKSLNTTKQIVGDHSYSEWNFDLYPQRPGFTSLLLRVTMVEMLDGYGERKKDVFLLNKEVEITKTYSKSEEEFIRDPREIYEWTDRYKAEIYQFISENKTGQALSKLANFFQKSDLNLFHSVLLLQANWNEGRHQHRQNLITDNEWYTVQAKVNLGVLELIKNIQDRVLNAEANMPTLKQMIGNLQVSLDRI